jgi:hypothetical protein
LLKIAQDVVKKEQLSRKNNTGAKFLCSVFVTETVSCQKKVKQSGGGNRRGREVWLPAKTYLPDMLLGSRTERPGVATSFLPGLHKNRQ